MIFMNTTVISLWMAASDYSAMVVYFEVHYKDITIEVPNT